MDNFVYSKRDLIVAGVGMGIIVTMLGLGFGLTKGTTTANAASINASPSSASGFTHYFMGKYLLKYLLQCTVYLHQKCFLTREYIFSRLITLQKRCHVHPSLHKN